MFFHFFSGLCFCFLSFGCWYLYFCWIRWRSAFKKRAGRESGVCHSNMRRPLVPELPNHSMACLTSEHDEYMDHGCPFARSRRGSSRKTVLQEDGVEGRLSDVKAAELNMDHIFVSFSSFLWVMLCVYPHIIFLFLTGYVKYRISSVCIRRRWLQLPKVDYHRACADLILGVPSLAFLYRVMEPNNDGDVVAEFIVESLPYFNDRAQVFEEKCVLHVNLSSRRFQFGKIGARELTPTDAYVFLLFYAATSHGVVHALSNWGINPRCKNAFIRRMADVTILYNHFGFTGARSVYDLSQQYLPGPYVYPLRKASKAYVPDYCRGDRVRSHKSVGDAMQHVLEVNLRNGFFKHGHVMELMKHSPLVDFVVKVRNFFLNNFEEFRCDFPGIDAEAMFAGTILHSLDHSNLGQCVKLHGGTHCIKTDSGDFQCMAEMVRVTVSGFVDSLPGIGFAHTYKDAPHAFYQRVYAFARTIDQSMADRMDACIIK